MNTILIVDDEESILEVVQMILERQGYHVLTATGVGEASEILESGEHIDLILTDFHMADGVGIELCVYDRPTILMSAEFDTESAIEYMRQGKLISFIRKPFDRDHLLREISDGLSFRDNPYDLYW